LHLPLLLALWTGQRQGDLLRLPWSAYDGEHVRLRQSKTGNSGVHLLMFAKVEIGVARCIGLSRRRDGARPRPTSINVNLQSWAVMSVGLKNVTAL
jgi:hypothetical protein